MYITRAANIRKIERARLRAREHLKAIQDVEGEIGIINYLLKIVCFGVEIRQALLIF